MAAGSRLSGIRPLERSDIPRAASCISGQTVPTKFTAFLEEVFFDSPWADPGIPSLVYVEDGDIVGTLMRSARRMRFEGEPILAAVSAFFWVHPRARARGVGVRLFREHLEGPQGLTLTDGASDDVRRMWEMFGGRTAHLSCLSFHRIFKPWRFGASWLSRRGRSSSLGRALLKASAPLDSLAQHVPGLGLPPSLPRGEAVNLSPKNLLGAVDLIARRTRLHSDYDSEYIQWLFRELEQVDGYEPFWLLESRGKVWAELVLDRDRPVGWYVYHLNPGGRCRVLQFAAVGPGASTVLRHLFHGASARGATAVTGRLEPLLIAPLALEPGLVHYSHTSRMCFHARDARIVDAVLTGDALLSRLDGEWWLS